MSLKSLDKFVNKFSKGIVMLKRYEALATETSTAAHTALFKQLLEVLMKRRQYAKDQDLWKELYLRSIVFYRGVQGDAIGGIPTVFVTKHNEILPFYMRQRIHKARGAIMHFDTHLDENGVNGSARLPEIYAKYLETNSDRYTHEAQRLVWDIGAANSGLIFTTGIRDIIWCLPSWVPDVNTRISFFIKEGKHTHKLGTADDITSNRHMDEFTVYKTKPKGSKSATFTKLQTGRGPMEGVLKRLENAVLASGSTYILDVDLDYLVCNGKPLNKHSYKRESYDVQSFYRTASREFNEMFPRSKNDDTIELRKYARELHNEIKVIKKRIHHLIRTIKYLKKRGLVPSHISICDSTNVQFNECESCNSVSNNYVPHHLALYVHTKVVKALTRLFNDQH